MAYKSIHPQLESEGSGTKLKDRILIDKVGAAPFQADFLALGTNLPAPHERMSCIVGLRGFSTCFETPEARGLFARCILILAAVLPTTLRQI